MNLNNQRNTTDNNYKKKSTMTEEQIQAAKKALQPLCDKLDNPKWNPSDLATWIDAVSDALKTHFPTTNLCDEFNKRMPKPEPFPGFVSNQTGEVVMSDRYTEDDISEFEEDGRRYAITLLDNILSELTKELGEIDSNQDIDQ